MTLDSDMKMAFSGPVTLGRTLPSSLRIFLPVSDLGRAQRAWPSPPAISGSSGPCPACATHSLEVFNLHDQEQILLPPEDGIFGNTDFLQFRQQSRRHTPVRGVIFCLLA